MSEEIEGLEILIHDLTEFNRRSVSREIVHKKFMGVISLLLSEADFPPYMKYEVTYSNEVIVIANFSMYGEFSIDVIFNLKHHCIEVSSCSVERDFTNFDASDFILFMEEANLRKKQDLIDLSVDSIPFKGIEGVRAKFSAKISCYSSRLLFDDIQYVTRMIVEYQFHACFMKDLDHPGLFVDYANED